MLTPPPVVAFWPFASAGMLAFGLAALAPVLIHLWNRRQRVESPWAAMGFLMAALRRKARRIRLEQLLLLLVRVSIPLTVAVALADPMLALLADGGGGDARTHLVLVLDASYSMTARQGEETRFQRAQRLAGRLVEQGREGDGYSLIMMGDAPDAVIGSPAFAPSDVIRELEGLRPPHGGAALVPTLADVESVLQRSQENFPRLKTRKVYLFTDLGRTTWSETATPECRRRLDRLSGMASLRLVDVGEGGVANDAITLLSLRQGPALLQRPAVLELELRRFANASPTPQRLEIRVDGQRVQEQTVAFAQDGSASVSFPHLFQTPGEHQVEARLDDDALTLDNQRYLSVPVKDYLRTAIISGKQPAARYVELALRPDQEAPSWLHTEILSESALAETELSQYDCLFLCDIGRFGRDEATLLCEYVEGGGSVIFFLGDQAQPDNYNAELAGDLPGKRVLPVRLAEASAAGDYQLDPRGYQHPLIAPFRGHEASGLLSTPIWKYWRMTPVDPQRSRVALALQNGDPLIVEERILQGRSIVVGTPASPQSVGASGEAPTPWNALVSWPSFLPLVQEMLALAISDQTLDRNVLVGQRFEGSVADAGEAAGLTVVAPDGRSQRVAIAVADSRGRWAYGNTLFSGFYQARFGPSGLRSQLFAVNLNTVESDLTRLDLEQLPSQLQRQEALDADEPSTADPRQQPGAFRWLLGGALMLLLTESLLAWRFRVSSH